MSLLAQLVVFTNVCLLGFVLLYANYQIYKRDGEVIEIYYDYSGRPNYRNKKITK